MMEKSKKNIVNSNMKIQSKLLKTFIKRILDNRESDQNINSQNSIEFNPAVKKLSRSSKTVVEGFLEENVERKSAHLNKKNSENKISQSSMKKNSNNSIVNSPIESRLDSSLPYLSSLNAMSLNSGQNFYSNSDKLSVTSNNKYSFILENIRNSTLQKENIKFSFDKIIMTNEGSLKKAMKFQNLKDEILQDNSQPVDETKSRGLKKFPMVYDSYSDEEYQTDDAKESPIVIDPKSAWKRIWDVIMIIFVFYSCLIGPYLITFKNQDDDYLFFEAVVDLFFLIDLGLNFFTPYTHHDDFLIKNPKKIIMHYLKTWFTFDLISSLPISFIILFNENNNRILSIIKITRVHKIIKWARIFRLTNFFKNDKKAELLSEIKMNHDSSINRIIKFFLFFFILTHISTCAWVYIANEFEEFVDGNTWINAHNMRDSDNLEKYIASLYFNLVTVYTIGYGDITSHNSIERIYNIVFMFVGVLLFSFAISSLSTIFSKLEDDKKFLMKRLILLEDISKEYKMSSILEEKIRNIVKYQQKNVTYEKFDLLETLPYSLKREVIMCMYRKGINNIGFFKKQDRDFIIFALPLLRSLSMIRNDILIAVGDYVEEMYIVLKGALSIRMDKFYENLEIAQIKKNMHFGEVFMYLNENSPYLVNCKTKFCDLILIRKQDFTRIKLAFNENVLLILRKSCEVLEIFEKTRRVVMEMYSYGIQVNKIKTYLRKLNKYLLKKSFDGFLNYGLEIENAEDFILSHDTMDIMKFLKSNMTEKDFIRCFIKEKSYRKLSKVSSESDSSKSDDSKEKGINVKIQNSKEKLTAIVEFSDDSDSEGHSKKKQSKKFLTQLNKYMAFSPIRPKKDDKKIKARDIGKSMRKTINFKLDKENKILNTRRITDFNSRTVETLKKEFEIQDKFNELMQNKSGRSGSFIYSKESSSKDSPEKSRKYNSDSFKYKNSIKSLSGDKFNIFNLYNYENNQNQNFYITNNNINNVKVSTSCDSFSITPVENLELKSKYLKCDCSKEKNKFNERQQEVEVEHFTIENSKRTSKSPLTVCPVYSMCFHDNHLQNINRFAAKRRPTLFENIISGRASISDARHNLVRRKNFLYEDNENSRNNISSGSEFGIKRDIIKQNEDGVRRNSILSKVESNIIDMRLKQLKKKEIRKSLTLNKKNQTRKFDSELNFIKEPDASICLSYAGSYSNLNNHDPKVSSNDNSLKIHSLISHTRENSQEKRNTPSQSKKTITPISNKLIRNSAFDKKLNSDKNFNIGKKQQSAFLTKENIFDKVSTGLQLDELYHKDKHYLFNNINNYIQESEEYTKHSNNYIRRLDKIFSRLDKQVKEMKK
jgi:hypothetical protein